MMKSKKRVGCGFWKWVVDAGSGWFGYQVSVGNFCNRMDEKMKKLFNF